METIIKYDRNEAEIYTDDSQEEVYINVEEAKAWHSIGNLMVWLEVALYYGKEYKVDFKDQAAYEDFKSYCYRESKKYSDTEKDFDSFLINELGFKWLNLYDTPPPVDYTVVKIFSRGEAEEIKKKIDEKSSELNLDRSVHVIGFNQLCPKCRNLTELSFNFIKKKCECGHRLPDIQPEEYFKTAMRL